MSNTPILYKPKSSEEIRIQLVKNLPSGLLYDGFNIPGTVMYSLYKAYAIVLEDFDKWMSNKIQNFILSPESEFLDGYWERYGLSDLIAKPENKEDQYNIVSLMIKARAGVFTTDDIEELVSSVFGVDITLRLLLVGDNPLPSTLPILLLPLNFNNYTILLKFEDIQQETENQLPSLLPGLLTNIYSYQEIIYNFLRKLININYKIVQD